MCKLEPEQFLRVRHISPLHSFLLFFLLSFFPPSLSPFPLLSFFLPLLTIWKHSCFEYQAQQAAHFLPGCVSQPTPPPPFGSPSRPSWSGSLLSMSWPGAEVCSQLLDRWCEGFQSDFVSCCENCFNVVVKHGVDCDTEACCLHGIV